MDLDIFTRQIQETRLRAANIQERARRLPTSSQEIFEESLEELQVALEELRVAEEEMRTQNDRLALAYEALNAERHRYYELFEFAPDAYMVTNSNGVIQEANSALADLLGVNQNYPIGKPLIVFVDTQQHAFFLSELERLRRSASDAPHKFELVLRSRAGTPFHAEFSVAFTRDHEGKLMGLRWIVRDVTERKLAEEKIRALNAQLQQEVSERTAQLHASRQEVERLTKARGRRARLPVGNRLLASLSPEAYARILPNLQEVPLKLGEVLYIPDDAINHVYFPLGGVISLVCSTEAGGSIEVGMVGNDGMVGMPLFLGSQTSAYLVTAQVAGSALRMKAEVFEAESARHSSMHGMLLRYAQLLLTQTTQSVVCNRFHSLEERFCRWLLMIDDRVEGNEFQLTQEFIAEMLGVRRSGVTVAAGTLQSAGLISYTRGKITILDRRGVEALACECYQITKEAADRLLGA